MTVARLTTHGLQRDLRPWSASPPAAHPLVMSGSARATAITRVLAVVAGVNAVAAWAGAVGLVVGFLTITPRLEQRLPLDSPVLGGLALAAIVAVPLSVLAALAWTGDPRTPEAAVVAGGLLMGWIVVQLAFIRELSGFHPFYLGLGAALAAWGRHHRRDL